MKIEITKDTQFHNPKEPILCGIVNHYHIYANIDSKPTVFSLRYHIKDGKVTVLKK